MLGDDDFGNAVDPQPSIDWTSSDGSIATVFSTGVLTANGLGSTTVLAVAGGLSATTRVTVEQAPNSIVLSPESISLGGPGDSTVILATVSDARGAEITVPNLTWTSSNTGVVTVDSVGLVRAVTF
ncbi:MAG: Ig-like domain-containing protein, partial [Chloroflexi bacterium]|nr:Ig-like domain-containing protein [Chloroflexota bacterium]